MRLSVGQGVGAILLGAAFSLLSGCGQPEAQSATPAPSVVDVVDTSGAVPWSVRADYEEWVPPPATNPEGYVDPPARWMGVATTLDVPATITPGKVLEYVVTVRNVGDRSMDLTPCPGYFQELTADPDLNEEPLVDAKWRLPCDDVGQLAPGDEQRFVMHLDVPAEVPGSELSLRWELLDAWDTGAQAWLPVRD